MVLIHLIFYNKLILIYSVKAEHSLSNMSLLTDALFNCPIRRLALSRSAAAKAAADYNSSAATAAGKMFLYHFNEVGPFMAPVWTNHSNAPECTDRVCHAEELPYVFHAPIDQLEGVPSWSEVCVHVPLADDCHCWTGSTFHL